MPPSPLAIATSALSRLKQERKSYALESLAHEHRVRFLKVRLQNEGPDAEDGNLGWIIEQEKLAYKETEAVFGPLGKKIEEAEERLRGLLEGAGEGEAGERERAENVLREFDGADARNADRDGDRGGGGS